MGPLAAGQGPAIFKDRDVLETLIALQIENAGSVGLQDALDLVVVHCGECLIVIARLDDDFMRAEGAHPIVNSVRHTARLALDAIKRVKVRDDADLRLITPGNFEERGNRIGALRAKGTTKSGMGTSSRCPTRTQLPGDGIFTEFHVSDC